MCSFGNTWDRHLVNTSKTWDASSVQPEIVVETVQQGDNDDVEMPPKVVELPPEAKMDFKQKIYSGDSGLRRGVAYFFKTPLEAFQRAGSSLTLVEQWTKNSNS